MSWSGPDPVVVLVVVEAGWVVAGVVAGVVAVVVAGVVDPVPPVASEAPPVVAAVPPVVVGVLPVVAGAVAAADAGLMPVVCVGETERQRLEGEAGDVVGAQVVGSLPPGFAGAVAYEPIWAIGTGRTPEEADVALRLATVVASCWADCHVSFSGSAENQTLRCI